MNSFEIGDAAVKRAVLLKGCTFRLKGDRMQRRYETRPRSFGVEVWRHRLKGLEEDWVYEVTLVDVKARPDLLVGGCQVWGKPVEVAWPLDEIELIIEFEPTKTDTET